MSATSPPVHPTAARMASRRVPAAVVGLPLLWTIYGCLYLHVAGGFVLYPTRTPHAWPTMGKMAATRAVGLRDSPAGAGRRDRESVTRASGIACTVLSMTSSGGEAHTLHVYEFSRGFVHVAE